MPSETWRTLLPSASIINVKDRFTHAQPLLYNMKALKIFHLNLFHIIFFIIKCKKKIAPPIFHNLFTPIPEKKYNIQSRGKLTKPHLWNEPWSTFMEWTRPWQFSCIRFTAIISKENKEIYIGVSWYRIILLFFLILINSLPPRVPFFLPSENITFSMDVKRERGEFMG